MRWTLAAVAIGLAPAAAQTPTAAGETGGASAQAIVAAAPHCAGDAAAPKVPTLLAGYGGGGFPIRTADAKAQAFFDNGMQLAHAFAHKAAVAAFHESGRIDPACAMCLWGEAWAAGPTINYPISKEDQAKLAALVARAAPLAAGGPVKEQQLIAALRLRYAKGSSGAANKAFAEAMARLAAQYPADDEILVVAADAWLIAATDKATVGKSIALLETVLRRNPDYTPAIHFYIHATEVAGEPAKAEPYADRLVRLAPSASHLVHMPSHTWYHVGRYQEAADTNVRAVELGKANARRLGLPAPDGVWQLPYHAHNVQYGVGSALISGDAHGALLLSDPVVARAGSGTAKGDIYAQMVAGTAYFAEGRFAAPDKVSVLGKPPLPYALAYWHYARGEAAARTGNAALVRAEAATIPDHVGPEKSADSSDAAGRMMRIAHAVLDGRAAMLEQQPAAALVAFRKAARMQETKGFLGYSDPPAFWYPVRRDIAAALLALGRPQEARRETDATLKMMPKDPVTLAIRAQAEAKLGAVQAAEMDRSAAKAGWHGDPALLPGGQTRLAAR